MHPSGKIILFACCLVGAGVFKPNLVRLAHASPFTAFADDEDVCRRVGAAAIKDASGPSAAQRYDAARGQCMMAHLRTRQMRAYAQDAPPVPQARPGPSDNSQYPDAFYSIPYATPGYGYDGFSY